MAVTLFRGRMAYSGMTLECSNFRNKQDCGVIIDDGRDTTGRELGEMIQLVFNAVQGIKRMDA